MQVFLRNQKSPLFLKNIIRNNKILSMNKNENDFIKVVFAGGGTGGHIYPGLAVADSLRELCQKNNRRLKIFWIGNSAGMDKDIVCKNVDANGNRSADVFYGIPSGKLRRYMSFRNFLDLFKIFAGLVCSFFILLKTRPAVLFSKGGFVSVPPCFAAKLLHIPVFTHECDFTPGLATKINSKSAKKILISYEETKNYLSAAAKSKAVVTGNPVRPVFYNANAGSGLSFLGIKNKDKPVLVVVGGSLGAKQINDLVKQNIQWLCENFIVVHQTGAKNVDDAAICVQSDEISKNYKPYPFIYKEMPDVMMCADVILSRAGANSIWECASLDKPMVLVPLCGSGTRGDQEDNAAFFEKKGAAIVLSGENATGEKLVESLSVLLDEHARKSFCDACRAMRGQQKPALKIAELIFDNINGKD